MAKIPTDDEIREMRSVPVEVAAAYIGVSPATIRNSLKQFRAPFGCALRNDAHYVYNIPGPALVRYRNEGVPGPMWHHLRDVIKDSVNECIGEAIYELDRIRSMKT